MRYFGTDASTQYREDRVSIYLRAVSTSNGKILKTIYTTKSILSQEVSMGVFRYVKFKRLLEAETGYTYNEPTELAVTEAIEKAVLGLIVEGVLDNLWTLSDQEEIENTVIQEYMNEKEERLDANHIGIPFELDSGNYTGPPQIMKGGYNQLFNVNADEIILTGCIFEDNLSMNASSWTPILHMQNANICIISNNIFRN